MRPPPGSLLLWFLAAAASAAQEAADAGEGRDGAAAGDEDPRGRQEETVVVTASKHGQKITETPASVTVLTAEDIAATGAVTIVDVFRRVPGLDISQIGARDCQVNARGFNGALSRRLLVLVDGRSVYVDLMGFTLWDTIQVPLQDISRIEVVRGPGSALYGANASSGVVNIITKSAAELDGAYASVGYGQGDTVDASVLYGRQMDKLGFKCSAGYFRTDAFENPYATYINTAYENDSDTGARQGKAAGRLSYDVDPERRWLVEGGYGGTAGVLFTGIGPLDIQPGAYLGFVRAAYTSPHWYLQAFWNRLEGETLNLTSLQENQFHTDSHDAEAQYHRQVGRHFLVVGASARRSIISTDLASRDEAETTFGIYAQDEVKLTERITANVALRVDHDELIGTVAAPKAGVLFAPSAWQSYRLTVATAYNSSSFIESYLDWAFHLPLGEGNVLTPSRL
jgi:iron complex outermembrane receptor protein